LKGVSRRVDIKKILNGEGGDRRGEELDLRLAPVE
jgi:hypothetical protein